MELCINTTKDKSAFFVKYNMEMLSNRYHQNMASRHESMSKHAGKRKSHSRKMTRLFPVNCESKEME